MVVLRCYVRHNTKGKTMQDVLWYVLTGVVAFLATTAFAPIVIGVLKKEKMRQNILSYVDNHAGKAGTPTMGGIIFLFSICFVTLVCTREEASLARVALLVFVANALVGFLDDYLKFKHHQNLGLRPYQKMLTQVLIAIGVGVFVYLSPYIGTDIILPFSKQTVSLGWGIIPFTVFLFLACTNSVNLTDGLDGLASSTTMCYMLGFMALLWCMLAQGALYLDYVYIAEYKNMLVLASCVVGAMLSFLTFNSFPAKVFMGDTGSLGLGALVACVAVFTKTTLFIPLFGIMFVCSAVSVMVQVAYYKKTKKRVFLMAPLHHHFERKGYHEVKIVVAYAIITLIVSLCTVLLHVWALSS